jgi:Bacterial conjugation TrbI-like protein
VVLGASPFQLMAGTVIAASLITGLNSDLPGFVIAQVTENVFDTVSGRHLLIPQAPASSAGTTTSSPSGRSGRWWSGSASSCPTALPW